MTLHLSPEIESLARQKAALAGLTSIESFVERIIENVTPEQALLPAPNDPRIVTAINAGFASGVEGKIDEAFWQARAEKLNSHIAKTT